MSGPLKKVGNDCKGVYAYARAYYGGTMLDGEVREAKDASQPSRQLDGGEGDIVS